MAWLSAPLPTYSPWPAFGSMATQLAGGPAPLPPGLRSGGPASGGNIPPPQQPYEWGGGPPQYGGGGGGGSPPNKYGPGPSWYASPGIPNALADPGIYDPTPLGNDQGLPGTYQGSPFNSSGPSWNDSGGYSGISGQLGNPQPNVQTSVTGQLLPPSYNDWSSLFDEQSGLAGFGGIDAGLGGADLGSSGGGDF